MSLFAALTADYEIEERKPRLTDVQVADIRRLYATGNWRQVDLAAEYGVCQPEISRIVNKKRRA